MKLTLSNRSRASRAPAPVSGSKRTGMTLIEVIVSLVILSGVLLATAAFMARYANVTGTVMRRSEAGELVADRLEEVKGAIRYSAIDSIFAKTESSIPNHPGFQRQTIVTRTGGMAPSFYDYKTVTVIVTGAGLKNPSKKTTVISVF